MMRDPSVAVVIPFRDRGRDPLRAANLNRVFDHWSEFPAPLYIVDDGRQGDAQFNRSAAYNRGRKIAGDPDVIVFVEADMIAPFDQIRAAIVWAAYEEPCQVIPFKTYRYLTPESSELVRAYEVAPEDAYASKELTNGRHGPINVISRAALDAVGQWDETFDGNWYDDSAMRCAFKTACGREPKFIPGPAHALYHLPGWQGEHLTGEDIAATERNKRRWQRLYRTARTPERIRYLTAGGQ